MKILVTGAKGFVGKNLCAQLKNIRDGKARCYDLGQKEDASLPISMIVEEVFEYDIDSTQEEMEEWCQKADFVNEPVVYPQDIEADIEALL